MLLTGAVKLRPIRDSARAGARVALRAMLASRAGIGAANAVHRALPVTHKRRLFYLLAGERCRVEAGWTVVFAQRLIRLPLHRDFPLSWCAALGFHGYDPEIHAFYEALVGSPDRPRVFFDVGAGYGLHSVRFLAAGIPTISFEPNPECHPYLHEACALNGLHPEIHGLAVAEAPGQTELAIPGAANYLASIVPAVKRRWAERADVVTRRVPQTSLDAFVAARGLAPDLIKIDTEGGELAVLRGARGLLEARRPLVVLESWPRSDDRAEIFALLEKAGYATHALILSGAAGPELEREAFLSAPASNFLAQPRERRMASGSATSSG
jgi:FkbM family methyltransferase